MEKINLYNTFGCETKEQLYEKMQSGADDIRPLFDFLDYAKGSLVSKEKPIESDQTFYEYVRKVDKPTKSKVQLLFVNTKNIPIYSTKVSINHRDDIKRAISEALNAGASRVFLTYHDKSTKKNVSRIDEILKFIGIEMVDKMKYIEADNEFISYRNENTFSGLYNYPEYKETLFIHEENNEIKDFSNYENYNEFSSFLAERENQNLNIITDIEKIKTNLKLGFQHEKQEIFGCILYDDDYKIQKSINIFKGGVSSSIVDPRILFQEILKNESAGFIVYHNHPSGTTKPSNEDMIITKRISTISEQLGLQFCDHFIIGKEQILSFAKEVDSMLFNNIDYTIDVVNAKESDSIYKAQYKDFEDTKKTISNMIYSNYENYVKAILSLEKGIEDINILNKAFDMFMSDDSMFLLDEKIDSIIELAKKLVVLDKKKNIAKENISDKSKNKLSNNEKMSKESKKLDQIL
ncbi:DNA repair protein RadC [Acetoanaerobium pronyense]|uniref:DNA repair protein RadC n=1 Tax=Acetoanaerobium pronyense TaxID=1482736 RepID=A0ABS4KL42_9FIRM|nr:DNA repair protein RadC [Acetoanaerobium pronyense]